MKYPPRDFQTKAAAAGTRALQSGKSLAIVSPTGSGKSLVLALMLEQNPEAWLTVPTVEIGASVYDKIHPGAECNRDALRAARIVTAKEYLNRLMAAECAPPKFLLVDECFPAGTVVDERPIESIRVGDTVESFSGPRRVVRTFKSKAPALLIEVRAGGHKVSSTLGHPFWTQRGWVNASDLSSDDSVLLRVSGRIYPEPESATQGKSRNKRVLLGSVHQPKVFKGDVPDQPGSCGPPDEDQEPDAPRGCAEASVPDADCDGSQAQGSGGQRTGERSGSDANGRNGVGPGDCSYEGSTGGRHTEALQAGPLRPGNEASNRSGWPLARQPESEGRGSQERGLAILTRVESVTVLERASCGGYGDLCPDGYVYNLEVEGDPTYYANGIGVHNCHHSSDDTHELIHALAGHCPRVGVTATYFRGTPDETLKLRKMWGEPYVALTLREASERGIVSIPRVSVWPLLNDETLKVSNGEFETKSVEGAIEKQLPDLIDRVKEQLYDRLSGLWSRPTIFTLPGVRSAKGVGDSLSAAGLPAVAVVGGTHDRQAAFASVLERREALVHVNVVAEGIDLPLRVSVDLAPTMSPVRFMQGRLGRITRPVPSGEQLPDYICTNHNVTRHSYLLAGLIPREQIKQAQQAWGPEWKPSRRSMARALGLEGFGRFTVSSVPLQDGTLLSLYSLQTPDGLNQYCVLLLPDEADPYYFKRTNVRNGQMGEHRLPDGRVVQYPLKDYGRWQRIDSIPSADGYVSVKPQTITPNMRAKWDQLAGGRGLDVSFVPDARQFTVLFVLLNAGIRFK